MSKMAFSPLCSLDRLDLVCLVVGSVKVPELLMLVIRGTAAKRAHLLAVCFFAPAIAIKRALRY